MLKKKNLINNKTIKEYLVAAVVEWKHCHLVVIIRLRILVLANV